MIFFGQSHYSAIGTNKDIESKGFQIVKQRSQFLKNTEELYFININIDINNSIYRYP